MKSEKISESFIIRAENGSVDVEASLDHFETCLRDHIATAEQEGADIGVAVNAVFDQHRGVCINMPALTSMTLSLLGVTPSTYVEMGEKVGDFVRSHKDVFSITKGKGGGCRRVCDTPPKSE